MGKHAALLSALSVAFAIGCSINADDTTPDTQPGGGSSSAGTSSGGAQAGSATTGGSTATAGSATAGAATAGAGASTGGASVAGSSSSGGAGAGNVAGASGGGAGGAGGSSVGGVGGASGGTSGAGGTAAGGTAAGGTGSTGSALPAVTDYTKAGPFSTMVDTKVGPNNGYTVYRPATLGADGFKHPPIVFGPGIGQNVTVHATMLTNFASHGYVVVGTPVLNGGPGDAGNLKSMQDGLTWILAQNDAAGVYQGKLDVNRAISMGYSVGGTAAVQLGGNKAIATTVSIHGHTAMSAMHGPLFQTTGTKDTVGLPLQQSTYSMSQVQTFMATLTGADHGYIQNAGGGEERPAILAWMRYWINGDQGAKRYFFDADCVLCKAPWENPQRKNWK
jgi:dienelactone hydrolase